MSAAFCLPQETKLVTALKPQAGAALTGAYVSLKNYGRCFVMVDIDQANAATMAISIEQASAVAGTGSKVITVAVPIWANQDCATTDTLVRQTDAVDFTTSAAVKVKKVVFEIDPATLDINNGFDCVCVKTAASNAANITAASYVLTTPRFSGATPASAVVD
jgi:hypothetical protein